MSQGDWFIWIGIGAGFIILGILGIIWGRHEEKNYFEALAERNDVREFMSHWPERPQSGAVMTGGIIALILGGMLLIAGIVIWIVAAVSS